MKWRVRSRWILGLMRILHVRRERRGKSRCRRREKRGREGLVAEKEVEVVEVEELPNNTY